MKFRLAAAKVISGLTALIGERYLEKELILSLNAPRYSYEEISHLGNVYGVFMYWKVITNVISGEKKLGR